MGTDIHGVFQAFDSQTQKWKDIPSEYEQDRDYFLFAILADVRNGYGFAGVPIFNPVVPISELRGFPADFEVEDETHPTTLEALPPWRREWYEKQETQPVTICMGDHSHSWLLGSEMVAYFDQHSKDKMTHQGVVELKEYQRWKDSGEESPKEWCGGISGNRITVSKETNITDLTTHVQCEWQEPFLAGVQYFIDEVKKLMKEHGEVRFVFGFDS